MKHIFFILNNLYFCGFKNTAKAEVSSYRLSYQTWKVTSLSCSKKPSNEPTMQSNPPVKSASKKIKSCKFMTSVNQSHGKEKKS